MSSVRALRGLLDEGKPVIVMSATELRSIFDRLDVADAVCVACDGLDVDSYLAQRLRAWRSSILSDDLTSADELVADQGTE